jgi:hypothetical protein
MRQRAEAWWLGMAHQRLANSLMPLTRVYWKAVVLGTLPSAQSAFPFGRVPGTTALLDESTGYRTPQGCTVHLRAAH